MDIQLSGEMDGIQAAEQISRLQIPVVYVTGYNNATVLNRAMLTEPGGYVLKPYETSDLKIGSKWAYIDTEPNANDNDFSSDFKTFWPALRP